MPKNERSFKVPQEKIIGRFFAITFDNQAYNFIVTDQLSLYCNQIDENCEIKSLVIKPNFEVCLDNGEKISAVGLAKQHRGDSYYENGEYIPLVARYIIPEELVHILIITDIISYSTDMAYLYGLNPDYARDKQYQTRAFKCVKNDSKRLLKQKQGIFN